MDDGNGGANYAVTFVADTTGEITEKDLTVTATGINKVYDGTTAATVTLSDDRVPGDVLVLNYTDADFDDKNVGTGKDVSVSGISISGADAGNYNANTTADTTADITLLAITGSITADNKVYDNNNSATIATRTLTGAIVGDDVSYTGGTATFDTEDVGTGKLVSATDLSLSGADSGNYTVNTTANTTADITPRLRWQHLCCYIRKISCRSSRCGRCKLYGWNSDF
ncbi:MAG: Fibronectin type III domain protein [Candidatus Nomurabacteria bacterium GW2011_GWB1_47_6]|uniref:Fibronectin type III domain protein n=1 Tax=Candidatus Nomurabacteria bacterium GW2011_GWB1_47_6 TaxID=1618749 RepID=A0A0G1T0V6_9BACT|nr:MAG: Fibronectin type III domain protein [Candidatus Nomurabacteria bacterium GW2011_GWB1_47_6]